MSMKKSVNQYLSKNVCVHMHVPPYVCTCTLMCVCVLPSCWAVQCGAAKGGILPEGRWKCSAAPVSWREEDKMGNKQG